MASATESSNHPLPAGPTRDAAHWSQGVTRLLGGVFLLLLVATSALVALISTGLVLPREVTGSWPLGQAVLDLAYPAAGAQRALIALGATTLGVLSLGLLLVSPPRRRAPRKLHLVTSDDEGFVVVDSAAVESIAVHAATSVRGALEATAHVGRGANGAVRIQVRVQAYPGAKIKTLGDEIRQRIQSQIPALLGLEVERVGVRISLAETDDLARLLQ